MLNSASAHVVVPVPYVSGYGAAFLTEHLPSRLRTDGHLTLLTDLSPASVAQGSTEVAALSSISEACAHVRIVHLSRLHAKVYVADTQQALVSSGNLTYGGLRGNFEYGVCLNDPETVRQVRDDVLGYADLGTPVDDTLLRAYADLVPSLRAPQPSDVASHEQRQASEVARSLLRAVHDVPEGATSLASVFGRAVLHVLQREGSLSTHDLHEHVRALLPDLCDDTQDRVIDGRHFGKLWKHRVRNAQSHLKARGAIVLDDGVWRLR